MPNVGIRECSLATVEVELGWCNYNLFMSCGYAYNGIARYVNYGKLKNSNLGITKATKEWLCDIIDDYALKDKLEKFLGYDNI